MKAFCPNCSTKIKIPDGYQGEKIKCPQCKQVFESTELLDRAAPTEEVKATTNKLTEKADTKTNKISFNVLGKILLAAWMIVVLWHLVAINIHLREINGEFWQRRGRAKTMKTMLYSIQDDVSSIQDDVSWIRTWGVQVSN